MSCWSFYRTHYGDFLSVLLLINTTAVQCLAPYTSTTTTSTTVTTISSGHSSNCSPLLADSCGVPTNQWTKAWSSHVVVVALLRGQSKCKNRPVDHFGGLPGVSDSLGFNNSSSGAYVCHLPVDTLWRDDGGGAGGGGGQPHHVCVFNKVSCCLHDDPHPPHSDPVGVSITVVQPSIECSR